MPNHILTTNSVERRYKSIELIKSVKEHYHIHLKSSPRISMILIRLRRYFGVDINEEQKGLRLQPERSRYRLCAFVTLCESATSELNFGTGLNSIAFHEVK